MESLENNKSVQEGSAAPLIDWGSPEITENKNKNDFINNSQLFNNNPFDAMELKAATLDPFHLEPYHMKLENDPPCGNLLSPLWQPSSKKIKRSLSLINIDCVFKNVEKNNNIIKDDIVKDQTKTHIGVEQKEEIGKQQKENSSTHNILAYIDDMENEEKNVELVSTPDSNKLDIEKNTLCDEEKKQIREQTRKHIEMLIVKNNNKFQEEREQQLVFCTPKRNEKFILSKTHSLLNIAFINGYPNCLNNESDSVFDLDSLKPEWVDDNFSESDGSAEVHTPNDTSAEVCESTNVENQVDMKLKALYDIGMVEQKSKRCQTNLKCVPNKGPLYANVPLQQMVQDYEDLEIKEGSSHLIASSSSRIKPIASSTPDLKDTNATIKSPSNSIKLSDSSFQSMHCSVVESPIASMNVTKSIGKMSINDKKIIVPLNNSSLTNSAKKHPNSTIGLSGIKDESFKSIQFSKSNHSKSESTIGKIPKPMAKTRLPMPKKFAMPGKENSTPS